MVVRVQIPIRRQQKETTKVAERRVNGKVVTKTQMCRAKGKDSSGQKLSAKQRGEVGQGYV